MSLYTWDDFRFREDDGSESAASWLAALNVDVSLVPGVKYRLRYKAHKTDAGSEAVSMQWSSAIDTGGGYGSYYAISNASCTWIDPTTSDYFNQDDDCTQQLGSETPFITNNNGMMEQQNGATATRDQNDYFEVELCFIISDANTNPDDKIALRCTTFSWGNSTITNLGEITVDALELVIADASLALSADGSGSVDGSWDLGAYIYTFGSGIVLEVSGVDVRLAIANASLALSSESPALGPALSIANASLALSSDSLDIDAGASIVVDANRIAKIIFVMQNG